MPSIGLAPCALTICVELTRENAHGPSRVRGPAQKPQSVLRPNVRGGALVLHWCRYSPGFWASSDRYTQPSEATMAQFWSIFDRGVVCEATLKGVPNEEKNNGIRDSVSVCPNEYVDVMLEYLTHHPSESQGILEGF